jgi:hypothetical protein
MTIASSVESPEELERLELQHVCPEKALADMLLQRTVAHPHIHVH